MIPQRLISHVQSIFENSADLVYIKDTALSYAYINTTCMTRHQHAREDVLGKLDSELHFSKYANAYNTHDLNAIRGNIYYQLDATCTNSGDELFALTQKFPLKDELGKTHGVLAFTQLLNWEEAIFTLYSKNSHYKNQIKLAADKNLFFRVQSELSTRELELLYYYLQGKSTKICAELLDISERTIIFHLTNIKNKWKCHSKEAIFDKARKKGLIQFSTVWNLLTENIAL